MTVSTVGYWRVGERHGSSMSLSSRLGGRGRLRGGCGGAAATGLSQVVVGDDFAFGGVLHEPVEAQSSAAGVAAVEAEHPLVEVCLQVLGLTEPWRVPSIQRSYEPTNIMCVAGSALWAGSPEAATEVAWCEYSPRVAPG